MPYRLAFLLCLLGGVSVLVPRVNWAAEPAAPVGKAALVAALERKGEFAFQKVNLAEALDLLRSQQGLKIWVDRRELEQAGKKLGDLQIDLKVRHVSLKAALRIALEPLGLGYMLRDDVLVVTTHEKSSAATSVAVYPVPDLIPRGAVPGSPEAVDHDALRDLIEAVVSPNSWEDAGGWGSLAMLETSLVVTQNHEVHEEIARLIAELRRARLARPGAKPAAPQVGPWERSFPLKLAKVSLTPALELLGETAGIDILLDLPEIGAHAALAADPADDSLIDVQLDKTTLRPALREILYPHDLAFIERHGAVLVTSPEKAQAFLRLQLYDVKSLVRDRDGLAETATDLDYDAVLMLLMSAVNPSSWDDAGGLATLSAFDGFLVVLQTDQAHQQIAALLEQVRQVRATNKVAMIPPPDAEIRRALREKAMCEFSDLKLAEVLESLAEKHRIEIALDRPALQRSGVAAETPINLKLGEVKLHTALELLLEPLDLRAYVQLDRLVISTAEEAERHPCPRVYDLADFAAAAKKPKMAAHDVSVLITKTLEPSSWNEAGGTGTVVVFENTLVVLNSLSVQSQIEDLLAELRRVRPKLPVKP